MDWYNKLDEFTQELRLAGGVGASWRYILGFFYQHDDLDQYDSALLFVETPFLLTFDPFDIDDAVDPNGTVGVPNDDPAPPPRFIGDFKQKSDSYALFLHNEYDMTERLTVTAAARYTIDKTDINATTAFGANDPMGDADRVTNLLVRDTLDDSRTDKDFSWKLGLTWNVTDDLLAYTSLTTGFRTGGYSVGLGNLAIEFEPEEIFAQEIGMKGLFLDRTLQLNGAVFRYSYEDLQVNVDDARSPLVPLTQNIGKSITKGFEIDALWVPNDHWTARLGLGYLDAEFNRTNLNVALGTISDRGAVPLQGNRPVNTPEWQFNGLLRYQQPLMDGWTIALMTDFRYTDDRFLEATNVPADLADDYWVVNAQAKLASDDGAWELTLWGRNIFDEEYVTYINNLPGAGFKLDIFGEKASFGGAVRYNF